MSVFKNYAKYYDLLYRDKDYKAEVDYVSELISTHSKIEVKNILNMGCGTGKHDRLFFEKGFAVDAFDMSGEMIEFAKSCNPAGINFFKNSIKEFQSSKKYDSIVSLFHVLSYQVKNEDVNAMFRVIGENLKPGGVFVFDFWYGPAVLTEQPEVRVKQIIADEYYLTRTAVPELRHNENTVIVNYDVDVKSRDGAFIENIKESHYMRYFFLPELILFAENNNCQIDVVYNWMTKDEPPVNAWNVCILGKVKEKNRGSR